MLKMRLNPVAQMNQSERKPSEKVELPHTTSQDAASATKSTDYNSSPQTINPAESASSKQLRLIKTDFYTSRYTCCIDFSLSDFFRRTKPYT
ncbi:hypothetical protein PoB_005555700 [Plakobranchus ocellatus]|uniref:Uncharacterized protein n=1 Tax=Plakobranchus ocellatus TaxID=259542 RepID=A0AAV4CBX8_9GAST|nr:hypothetical protein PoB_005555700 [Plakobranchus ocellatus]